jgi:hypothetical protein
MIAHNDDFAWMPIVVQSAHRRLDQLAVQVSAFSARRLRKFCSAAAAGAGPTPELPLEGCALPMLH